MTTCRITDLIPVVNLKEIKIRDRRGDLALEDNSAFRDPHLKYSGPGGVYSSSFYGGFGAATSDQDDFLQFEFHICAEDIIFNPNVEDSMTTNAVIGATNAAQTELVNKYFASLEGELPKITYGQTDGYGNPLTADQISQTATLPEEIAGSILENDFNFSQYFSDKDFTRYFGIDIFFIAATDSSTPSGQIIRLLEEMHKRYDFDRNRSLGWKVYNLLMSIEVGYDIINPPMKQSGQNQGKFELDTAQINGQWTAQRIINFLVDSAGMDANDSFLSLDPADPGWILDNITPFTYVQTESIAIGRITFDAKTTNDLVNEASARYDENGNLIYSILPDYIEAITFYNNYKYFTHDSTTRKIKIGHSDINLSECAVFMFPRIDPSALGVSGLDSDYATPAFWDPNGMGTPNLSMADFEIKKRNYIISQDLFSGFGYFQRILKGSQSIYQTAGTTDVSYGATKIQDFREIQRLSNLNYGFYTESFQMLLSQLAINKPEGFEDTNLISNLYSSFHEQMNGERKANFVANYFTFNRLNYLRLRSTLAPFYENLYAGAINGDNMSEFLLDQLLRACRVKGLRIYRTRANNDYMPSTANDYYGAQDFKVNEKEVLICHTSDREPYITDYADIFNQGNAQYSKLKTMYFSTRPPGTNIQGIAVSSIKEIDYLEFDTDLNLEQKVTHQTVYFTDSDAIRRGAGKYLYRVEIDLYDFMPEMISHLFRRSEMMLSALDHVLNYIEYGKITQISPLTWNNPNASISNLPTNYYAYTNTINPEFFDSSGNPTGAYKELTDKAASYVGDFEKLHKLCAGTSNITFSFNLSSVFSDLESIHFARDIISTFLSWVDGFIGNTGSGRFRSANFSTRFNNDTTVSSPDSTQGQFARPPYSTYSYKFKDPVDIGDKSSIVYSVFGTKMVSNTTDEYVSRIKVRDIAIDQPVTEPYCTANQYINRAFEEYQSLNNDYSTSQPPQTAIPLEPQQMTDIRDEYEQYRYFSVKQVVKPDDRVLNEDLTTNRGRSSKSVFLRDVDQSLFNNTVPNRYQDPQTYNEDAAELSETFMKEYAYEAAQLRTFQSGEYSIMEGGSDVNQSTIIVSRRDNRLYKQGHFTQFLNENLASTVTCSFSKGSISDFLERVNDEDMCAATGQQESSTIAPEFSERLFDSSEYVDSSELLDPENDSILNNMTTIRESLMCASTNDYVTSRVLSYMKGYSILRRPDFVQGTPGEQFKFDVTEFFAALLQQNDASDLKPSQIYLQEFANALNSGGDLSFTHQLNLFLQSMRVYKLEYLSGFNREDMTEIWGTLTIRKAKQLLPSFYFSAAGGSKGLLCRFKLFNRTEIKIDNVNNSMNFPILNEYFILSLGNINPQSPDTSNTFYIDLDTEFEGGI